MSSKTTGWKDPQRIKQYTGSDSENGSSFNNNLHCYRFSNLNNIMKVDYSRAEQLPWKNRAVDSEHKSPIIYADNYGFNIPSEATITKISFYCKVNQVTHPLPEKQLQCKKYYEKQGKTIKYPITYSACKFHHVSLKTTNSTKDYGTGKNLANKCKVPMLPYKQWSTNKTTVFEGTPKEWGLTDKTAKNIINSTSFGTMVQFNGTLKYGWVNPAVALMRVKIDYDVPDIKTKTGSNPLESSTFTKLEIYNGKTRINFDDNRVSGEIGTLEHNDYSKPVILTFQFTHKGEAGHTPEITFESLDLKFGTDKESYVQKKTKTPNYSLKPISCSGDTKAKVYKKQLAIFPGYLMGEQKIKFKNPVDKYKLYTLKVKVVGEVDKSLFDGLGDLELYDKQRLVDMGRHCIVQNCVFNGNSARYQGGANYITTEFYYPKGNFYGKGEVTRNVAMNKGKAKVSCVNTYWRGKSDET